MAFSSGGSAESGVATIVAHSTEMEGHRWRAERLPCWHIVEIVVPTRAIEIYSRRRASALPSIRSQPRAFQIPAPSPFQTSRRDADRRSELPIAQFVRERPLRIRPNTADQQMELGEAGRFSLKCLLTDLGSSNDA